ncbi:MAG: DUF72 domain-containing protein [Ignavibacteriae bacterium]|nr:MAG: DUF72 domain-containing protein [Ignavibacteriota bacterium]
MLRIGTCSWKYDSWRGIVYSDKEKINYLEEYSQIFNTVEIDQWFWSLFPPSKAVLPKGSIVESYKNSIPNNFLFTIKVPNSITLTHYYTRSKEEQLKPNPYFLSNDLFDEFIRILDPIKENIGCLIFQFEYLNKQKMDSLSEFQNKFTKFYGNLEADVSPIGIEIRNPNYINKSYFQFLFDLNITPVFLEGYYMPPVAKVYQDFKDYIKSLAVIRLHGPDRKGIEKLANDNWGKIYINRNKELSGIIEMIRELEKREVDLFVNVNNHFEGSAPLTINKIKEKL